MSEKNRQTLTIDLDSLFPGATVTIGTQVLTVKPLGLEEISDISKKLVGISGILAEQKITLKNFNTAENIPKLAIVLIDNIPSVLEEASNIALADLKKLPLEPIVDILTKVIEVNIKSKESLEKNFKSLISLLFPTPKEETKDKGPKTPPKKTGK